jgi:hypothetical protein
VIRVYGRARLLVFRAAGLRAADPRAAGWLEGVKTWGMGFEQNDQVHDRQE